MLIHLADASIRSLVLALMAGIVLLGLRRRRSAALSHAVWTAATCGMLLLFALGTSLPRLPVPILQDNPSHKAPPAPVVFTQAKPATGAQPSFLPPVMPAPPRLPAPVHYSPNWRNVALLAYFAIAFGLLTRLVVGLYLVRRLLDGSVRIEGRGFSESASIAVPLTVGWIRPKVLLPAEWQEWDQAKLDAVLAHERSHVRRHDALVAVAAGLNRCLFWFHPLAWWLERRLALLAEQACDDACISTLGNREEYARILVDMAGIVEATRGRVYKHSLAMAAATHIRRRIDSILQEGRTFSSGLTGAGWAMVALGSLSALLGAGSVQLERQPALVPFPLPKWNIPTAPLLPPRQIAQQQPAPAPAPARAAVQPPLPAVFIPVSVGTYVGGLARYVSGLRQENFRLVEDGVEQPITQFLDANEPVSLAVIYDSSSGLLSLARRRLGAHFSLETMMQRAVLPLTSQTLFTNLNAEDEFLASSGQEGNLSDELRMTLRAMAGAKNPHKAIVVETDGADKALYSDDEIAGLAREANVPIFSVGTLVTSDGIHSNELAAAPLLRELADRTGGQYHVANDPDQMSGILLQIGDEIRYQYILGYNPPRQGRTGGYRNVAVQLVRTPAALSVGIGLPALSVRAGTGYYVP
jgi:beta-lactamase regulating signal transducer with metallopeptidase domain